MTTAAELVERHSAELRGFGASLPDDFAAAAAELESQLSEEDLSRWATTGIALANHSLRSWEAAAEYFRASPVVLGDLTFDQLMEWTQTATGLADESSVVAAAFLKATPDALDQIPPESLDTWAGQGESLCRGNWKSIALAALYFGTSPQLLDSLDLEQLEQLVGVVDALTERSYELATTCLEGAPPIFDELAAADREPFLRFARAVTRASWADTRLYFERGPALLSQIGESERGDFLELAAGVTTQVGRQGFPLFSDAAAALGEVESEDHSEMLGFAQKLAASSPIAAMEYLKSAPFVRSRLTPTQMEAWADAGAGVLFDDANAEGAEAFFRLESTRAEEMLAALSARIELQRVSGTLRLYSKALTGIDVSVRSTEDLVESGIGWVSEATATTEGTSIYLPPFVSTFEDRDENFMIYKVFATHQAGRLEFGSFDFAFGVDGAHLTSSVEGREQAAADGDDESTPVTPMERYFDLFEDRTLIAGLFTIIEDTRVDAYISREYGGIRAALRRLQAYEAGRRPDVREMGLRQAFVENLLRGSLNRPEAILWPAPLQKLMGEGLAALKVVEQKGASVQDSAEVAAALYELTERIPNILQALPEEDWEALGEEMLSISADMPGGDGAGDLPPSSEEVAFETPPQPDFRGDFKPELVQLLMKLKLQQGDSDGTLSPITEEQLKEMLEKSVEITISEWAEGDLSSSLGLFLSDLDKDMATPAGEGDEMQKGDRPGGGEEGEPEEDMPVEVEWSYYDEWDFRASDYRPRWTRVGERPAEEGELDYYEDTLKRHHGLVMETRRQFELLRPEAFRKIKRLEDGEEIDLDRAMEFLVDKKAGVGPLAQIYWRRNKLERDVAVAFLLDMSASTDEEIEKQRPKYDEEGEDEFDDDPRKYFQWLAQRRAKQAVEPPKHIIDLEKESTVLIVEALEAIGDSYGIYGFSGYGRENVEYYAVKDLDEPFSDIIRKRVDKIEPIRSTRMGPAIRHTIHKLDEYDAKVKILILVSDGRPQDHGYGRDRTEKEYAVHDTRQALLEAKRVGVTPFLITVDKEGHDYLGEMCEDIGYEVVADIESLPRRLPSLYRALATD